MPRLQNGPRPSCLSRASFCAGCTVRRGTAYTLKARQVEPHSDNSVPSPVNHTHASHSIEQPLPPACHVPRWYSTAPRDATAFDPTIDTRPTRYLERGSGLDDRSHDAGEETGPRGGSDNTCIKTRRCSLLALGVGRRSRGRTRVEGGGSRVRVDPPAPSRCQDHALIDDSLPSIRIRLASRALCSLHEPWLAQMLAGEWMMAECGFIIIS